MMTMMEWEFSVAVQKLVDLLKLTSAQYADAEGLLRSIVEGQTDKPVSQDRLDCAMRRLQQNANFGVSESTLTQALVHFYLGIQGITIPASYLELECDTFLKYLNRLQAEGVIAPREAYRANFFFILGKCNQPVVALARKHTKLRDAVRDGLSTNSITEAEAVIVTFCLLTDSEPSDARCPSAVTDLPNAVRSVLTDKKVWPITLSARYVESLLFRLDVSPEAIEDALDERLDKNGVDFVAARERYLLDFFKHRNGCGSEEKAKSYLKLSEWFMEPAGRAYKGDLPEAVSDVSELVYKYEKSIPSQTINDHAVAYMIERFHTGAMDGDAPSLGILRAQLVFRLGKCELAVRIVGLMGLPAGKHIASWDPHQALDCEDRSRMNRLVVMIKRNTTWFRPSQDSDGRTFEKPYMYVANAMVLEKKTDEEVMELIAQVKEALSEEVANA